MVKLVFPLLLLAGCSTSPPPPPVAPPEPVEPPFEFPHAYVWSGRPGIELRVDSVTTADIPRAHTRLDVIDADADGVVVRCARCAGSVEGRADWADVEWEALEPAAAAHGSISGFALAIRRAAERRDVEALRRVMARDFTYSLIGPQGREAALVVWQEEGFAALGEIARILDGGLATRDGSLWAAPAEHLEEFGYRGYRVGFRATPDGRWEWTFLIRGER
jgi:hypothetical protein